MSQFTQDLSIAGYGDAYAATAQTPTPESPTTDDDADEPTQAYSPGYVDAEVARQRAVRPDFRRLQLDPVLSKSPAVRLLIYPNVPGLDVSPYGGVTCDHEWVEVEADGQTEGGEPVRVLAVAPSADQIACAITHDAAHFRLYFDPTQDRLVLNNVGHCVLVAAQLGAEDAIVIEPHAAAAVCPGFWALTSDDGPLLECRILPRTAWSIAVRLSTKRRAGTLPEGPEKRTKLSGSRRAAVPAQALRPASAGNALVDLGQDETIHVVGSTGGGYKLTRLATIADRQKSSAVWQASHSGMPGRLLVVKVVKAAGTGANDTVRAAESWAREATIHSSLNHPTILRFLGSDARFHSLYLEHVDAKSLQHFRRQGNNYFSGSDTDAQRVARDIASALDYIHKKGISHGDIKPANILYSHNHGAVLIDFGLSFRNGQPPKHGGSPWYLAHEYMRDWRLRGPETDVFAFGVVALWTNGGIPLPETTATWWIADIHPSGAKPSAVASAIKTMMAWLKQVEKARAGLRQDEVLGGVIWDALEPEMKKRVNAATLKQRLSEIRL